MTCSFLARVSPLAAAVLVSACVAKDSDTLGELDDASTSAATETSGQASGDGDDGDDGATSAAMDGDDAADDAATTAMTSGSDDGDPPPPLTCDPGLTPVGPASCPHGLGLELPEPGCFVECGGEGEPCEVGTCQRVEYDPCPCPEGAEKCCGACASDIWLCVEDGDVVDAVCESIIGTTFLSVDELECGLGQKGPVLCHWQITFAENGEFLWMHSDVGEGGDYTCADSTLVVTNGPMVDVSFDPNSQTLTWDGVAYQPAAP